VAHNKIHYSTVYPNGLHVNSASIHCSVFVSLNICSVCGRTCATHESVCDANLCVWTDTDLFTVVLVC